MSSRISRKTKRIVAERAKFRCEYCRLPSRFLPVPMSVEHIVARARKGSNELENLALACQGCNGFKGACIESHDDATGFVVSLFHPRRQGWDDHFAWSEDFILVFAKSPIGRVTISRLQLNRIELVNLRKLLLLVGAHPPEAA
jgi:5-methylcytosine-specific restriction endonuclease McrA